MEFLRCTPSVFVIGNEYEILVNVKEKGIFSVRVGDTLYYEDNSGVLASEKTYAKIRVPQSELDSCKQYTVIYRKAINRKAYFSELSEPQEANFEFKPIEKTENINLYLISDVHYNFELAKQTASFFGDDVDLFVVNGDIGEVETEDNYFEVCRFVGDISVGKIPVIFVRGNHDTRGALAERFTDYFPADGKNTYFTFEIGALNGVVLDCGEDKWDRHKEYGGVNVFESFRRRETEFLKKTELDDKKITFAISHICPVQTTLDKTDKFNIEQELYTEWNAELARMGVKFMLCGHIHKAYIVDKHSDEATIDNDFPVVVGVACFRKEDLWGSAITVNKDTVTVRFTDKDHNVRETHEINTEV